MINISDEIKQKYINGNSTLYINIHFPNINLTLTNENITTKSVELTESLCDGNNIEYVGCISTCFSFEMAGIYTEISGEYLEVTISTGGSSEAINLFHGYVTEVERQESNTRKKVTCYDKLYYELAEKNVSVWYNGIYFPCTLKQFRQSLFQHLNLTYIERDLPADEAVLANRVFDTEEMGALDVIKQICQINSCFGIINRDGVFEFRQPDFISNTKDECDLVINTFRSIKRGSPLYSLYGVEVRDSNDDTKYALYPSVPSGARCLYIIQGNMFIQEMSSIYRDSIVQHLAPVQMDNNYTPFNADIPGYPFLEVGDRVALVSIDYSSGTPTEVVTYTNVLSRTLKGLPTLTDTIEANGEECTEIIITSGATFTNRINSSNTIARNMQYLMWRNTDNEYNIVDGSSALVINISAYITRMTHLCIDMQFICDVTTTEVEDDDTISTDSCDIKFLYYIDGEYLDFDEPIQTCVDGHNIVRLRHDSILDMGTYLWQVVINPVGGDVFIGKNKAFCIMNADGLAGDALWDGTLNVEDAIYPLLLSNIFGSIQDVVNTKLLVDTKPNIPNENVPSLYISDIFGSIEDTSIVDIPILTFNTVLSNNLTINALELNNTYTNGTLITDFIYGDITKVDIIDNHASYKMSTDGIAWYGYSSVTEKLELDYEMSSQEFITMPTSMLTTPVKIIITIEENESFTQLRLYGGKIQ